MRGIKKNIKSKKRHGWGVVWLLQGVGGCGLAAADTRRMWTSSGSSSSGAASSHAIGVVNSAGGSLNLEKQQLMLAVQAVAGGHMTGRQAARAFNVPRTTLRRWVTHDRRLHPCPYCPYRATERSHLKKHLGRRHRDLPDQHSSAMHPIHQLPSEPESPPPPTVPVVASQPASTPSVSESQNEESALSTNAPWSNYALIIIPPQDVIEGPVSETFEVRSSIEETQTSFAHIKVWLNPAVKCYTTFENYSS